MKAIYLALVLGFASAALAQDECTSIKERIDCHPDNGASEENCHARGCSWCPANPGQPWCFVKSDHGYILVSSDETPSGQRATLKRSSNASYFGNDAEQLFVDFEFQSDERLRIKITNGQPRFEVPITINPPLKPLANPLYEISIVAERVFSFKVIRKATGAVLLDTSLGGLTFSDQFIQLATRVPSLNVYGIGENEQFTFRHSFEEFATYSLYGRDQSPDGRTNSYGVQPYYTVLEEDGNAHSVVIVNSNAQEFQVTPAPGLVYRTIGGIVDMYVFLGPAPENTVQQFTQAVGRQPLPPYWGLGFQLSKWGYDNVENMKAAIDRTRAANIPLDVQYGDIDIMDQKLDFTIDPVAFHDFPEFIKELKDNGTKFIPIVDCGIPFDERLNGEYSALDLGNELDVWIKRPDGTPVVGAVWPGNTYYPDFSKAVTQTYWTTMLKEFKNVLDYDGIWIDMNEPASWGQGDVLQGCANNTINRPPYTASIKSGDLSDATLCPDSVQEYGIHYNTHSLYAWKQSEVTFKAMRASLGGKRGMVVTRSNFIGIGKWVTHWLGDNWSEWSDLRASIIGVLQYNQFGVPFVGPDTCGFAGASNAPLCQRWSQVGAFYPFSRNHNAAGNPNQDPGTWPEVAVAARKALEVRYTLLPSFYTLFFQHRTEGSTVVRALWHEFPMDVTARGIDMQFLWGSGILVSPVVEENVVEVVAYFPSASRWYDYYTGEEVNTGFQTLAAPLDVINVHVRGGGVYPTQKAEMNTVLARQNPFGLIVALDSIAGASGKLFVDDGDSADTDESGLYFLTEFTAGIDATGGFLNSKIVHDGYSGIEGQLLENIRLLGAPGGLKSVTVNGQAHSSFSLVGEEVKITALNIPVNSKFEIRYTFA